MAEAFQAGSREDDSIKLTLGEFSQTRINVASKGYQIQSRETVPKLNLPSKAAGSDPGAAWKVLECRSIRDERIARVFALRDCRKINAPRKLEGDILEAVDSEVDASIEECFVEFFRE